MTELAVVLDKLSYLEGPRWHDARVWVSDFYTHRVLSARADGSDLRVEADVPTATAFGDVLGRLVVGPDGLCADAEGAVWAADALGNRAVRVAGGEIVATVDAGTGVFAVALGGDDGRTLFLCTAPSFAEHERRDTRDAALLAARVEVPAA